MPFTLPTLAQAQTALAARLNDPGFIHWTQAELSVYLREALRWWNAATAHWRDQDDFNTAALTSFYDLGTVIAPLRARTVTNWDLVTDLQYALLEPPAAGGTWTGTDQFNLAVLSTAIQRRRDQFLRDTGSILTNTVTAYSPVPASGRIDLDEAVLVVRRATWEPVATGSTLQPLMRTDEWAGTHFAPAWPQSTDLPFCYSTSVVPPITLQLIPPPGADGDLDLVSLNKGAVVNPAVSAVLGIPNDFAWVVKFGALADLLQGDGLALDPARAAYCEARWKEGIELCKRAPVILAARIDGGTCRVGSLSDADSYTPTWQIIPDAPTELLLAGQNLLATTPRADGIYAITLDVVRNAPVPVMAGDVLQVGQDFYDSILDYAQHLALFKSGPTQVEVATTLLQRAAKSAGVELQIQQASQPSRRPLLRQVQQDAEASPRELPPVPVE